MDMLYARYSSPMDLMRPYINQWRFGDFIRSFLQAENDRRKEEADKNDEMKMWIAYVHSYSDKSYNEWKEDVLGAAKRNAGTGGDYDLTDERAKAIIDDLFTHGG